MIIPFDIKLAKMAVEADTGYITTVGGDMVEIMVWKGTNEYIYGKVYIGVGRILHCAWDTAGKIIMPSYGDELNLIIKPTISL